MQVGLSGLDSCVQSIVRVGAYQVDLKRCPVQKYEDLVLTCSVAVLVELGKAENKAKAQIRG